VTKFQSKNLFLENDWQQWDTYLFSDRTASRTEIAVIAVPSAHMPICVIESDNRRTLFIRSKTSASCSIAKTNFVYTNVYKKQHFF